LTNLIKLDFWSYPGIKLG